jgi:arylsulfatase A
VQVNGASARPNIVLIFADDVGTGEVPGYWNTGKVDMPNIQNLVDTGTVFTDVHSTPLCAPSRYVLLSGNYQHRGHLYGGTWQVNYKSGQFRDGQQSIAQVLQTKNYHTAMTGKWHLGG